MTSYVVETFVPAGSRERFADDVDALRRATTDASVDRVRHIRSYLVPGDEMGFHLVEAGTAADVERIVRQAGIEPERIVEAVGIDDSADASGHLAATRAGPDRSPPGPSRDHANQST